LSREDSAQSGEIIMNEQLNIYSGQENYMWMSITADYANISIL